MKIKKDLACIGDPRDPFIMTKQEAITNAINDAENTYYSKRECFNLSYNKPNNNNFYYQIYEQIYIPIYIEEYRCSLVKKGIIDSAKDYNDHWKFDNSKPNSKLEIMSKMKYGEYYINSYNKNYEKLTNSYGGYPSFAIPEVVIATSGDKKISQTKNQNVYMIELNKKQENEIMETINPICSNNTSSLHETDNPKLFILKKKQ